MIKDLEVIAMKLYKLENLAKLLEDYFYGVITDKEYLKHQALSEVLVEKIQDIVKDNESLISKMFRMEK